MNNSRKDETDFRLENVTTAVEEDEDNQVHAFATAWSPINQGVRHQEVNRLETEQGVPGSKEPITEEPEVILRTWSEALLSSPEVESEFSETDDSTTEVYVAPPSQPPEGRNSRIYQKMDGGKDGTENPMIQQNVEDQTDVREMPVPEMTILPLELHVSEWENAKTLKVPGFGGMLNEIVCECVGGREYFDKLHGGQEKKVIVCGTLSGS